ncbi:hypothetical protein B0T18DRAFT_151094 [Schizothecium vesticola]|uniref:Uncharacterized protein n=1 Tax=Schizothecium vesticola TaxID=314040 RepID=A0AA40K579_9PEZI|nr:hypothetical protein B0T18DRAFT_151094 [Schizothecium vesticola]
MFPVTRPPRPIFRVDSLEGHQRVLFWLGFAGPSSVGRRHGLVSPGPTSDTCRQGPVSKHPCRRTPSASTPRTGPCTVHHHAIQRPSRPPADCATLHEGAQRHGRGNPVDSSATGTYDGALSACRPERNRFRVGSFSSSPSPSPVSLAPFCVASACPGCPRFASCHPTPTQHALIFFSILAFVSLLVIPTFVPFSSPPRWPPAIPKLHSLSFRYPRLHPGPLLLLLFF